MWTADNRPRYNRDKLRYPSDLTDAEWAHIEPLIPPGKPGGGKRRVAIREVINGVMYILSTGCQWRALPKDLPPRSTVHDYLGLWNWDGTLDRIHHALYLKCREKAAREASPTACIIDCIFRDIRPPIPTTSAHLYRGIRPALTRCREALVFDISFLAFRHVVEGLSFGRIVRRVRAGRRCAPAGRGWHLRRWVHQ